jgi:hypothetical protein
MTAAVEVDPGLLGSAFDQALATDAARSAAAADTAAPPPREPWLNEDGTPRWGFKPDGVTPRRGPGGPGRPRKDAGSKPRGDTSPAPAGKPAAARVASSSTAEPRDYSEDIAGALLLTWMGLASTPWTKAHAAIVKNSTPSMIPAWNTAGQQNMTIRGWIEKLSGEGSWAWMIPVAMTTTPLAIGLWEVTRNPAIRAEARAQTESDWAEFTTATAREHGLELESLDQVPPEDSGADGRPPESAPLPDHF